MSASFARKFSAVFSFPFLSAVYSLPLTLRTLLIRASVQCSAPTTLWSIFREMNERTYWMNFQLSNERNEMKRNGLSGSWFCESNSSFLLLTRVSSYDTETDMAESWCWLDARRVLDSWFSTDRLDFPLSQRGSTLHTHALFLCNTPLRQNETPIRVIGEMIKRLDVSYHSHERNSSCSCSYTPFDVIEWREDCGCWSMKNVEQVDEDRTLDGFFFPYSPPLSLAPFHFPHFRLRFCFSFFRPRFGNAFVQRINNP